MNINTCYYKYYQNADFHLQYPRINIWKLPLFNINFGLLNSEKELILSFLNMRFLRARQIYSIAVQILIVYLLDFSRPPIFVLNIRLILTNNFHCLNSDNLRKGNPSFEFHPSSLWALLQQRLWLFGYFYKKEL